MKTQKSYPQCRCGETMFPASDNRREAFAYYQCLRCGYTTARPRDNRADVYHTQQTLQLPIEEGLFAEID